MANSQIAKFVYTNYVKRITCFRLKSVVKNYIITLKIMTCSQLKYVDKNYVKKLLYNNSVLQFHTFNRRAGHDSLLHSSHPQI